MATAVVMAVVIAVATVIAVAGVPAAAMATAVVVVAITVGSVVPWVPEAQVAVQATRRAARVVSGSVPRIAAGKHWYHYRFWRY
jgi:hypothetical protein